MLIYLSYALLWLSVCSLQLEVMTCDAMMHVLKDSINLKYSELLTKPISKCNLI